MIPDIRKLESRLAKLRPKHITVIAQYPNSDRRRLTVEEYVADDEADLVAIDGTDIHELNKVLNRYVGGETVID